MLILSFDNKLVFQVNKRARYEDGFFDGHPYYVNLSLKFRVKKRLHLTIN